MTAERSQPHPASFLLNGGLMEQGTEWMIPREVESRSAQAILTWAAETFHPRFALVTSFAAEGVVLIDMLTMINSRPRVITIDTERLPDETYAVIDAIRERYEVTVEVLFPQTEAVEVMTREHGVNLHRGGRRP